MGGRGRKEPGLETCRGKANRQQDQVWKRAGGGPRSQENEGKYEAAGVWEVRTPREV